MAVVDQPAAVGRRRVDSDAIPSVWLPLLAAPVAMGSNAPGLVLGTLSSELGAGIPAVTWVVTAFGLGLAVSTPLAGHLIRRRGPRMTLLVSAVLSVIGALGVLLAPTLGLVVAGRVVLALGGVGLMVLAINAAGTPGRAGLVSVGAGVGGALGPVVGLAVTSVSSWHVAMALSAVNLVAVPVLARRLPRVDRMVEPTRFDAIGAVLFVGLVSALVLSTHWTIALLVVGVTAVALVPWVRSRPEGFVPLALVRNREYLASCVTILVLATGYFYLLYHVPTLLRGAGWADARIGVTQLIVLLSGSLLALLVTTNLDRLGRGRVTIALATLALGAQVLALLGGVVPAAALGVAVLASVGGQATLMVIGTSRLTPEHRPVAVGLFTLCFQLGGAFGPMIASLLH
ncbi:MFS transporter [Actinokineospora enzanensis]|uniref:MFS transporter n=1 Tax=Actinokineospora enzanensis TaxID=155975 RepID=UPI0003757D22|nr:MFS transporter [Actinokineospora enzanensis]